MSFSQMMKHAKQLMPDCMHNIGHNIGHSLLSEDVLNPVCPFCRVGVNRYNFLLESLRDLDARYGDTSKDRAAVFFSSIFLVCFLYSSH